MSGRPLTGGRSRSRALSRSLVLHAAPLSDWRLSAADDQAGRRQKVLAALGRFALFGEPRWTAAASGDASSAIGLAIEEVMVRNVSSGDRLDLIMNALWRCAADADPAAVMVFCFMRKRLIAAAAANEQGRRRDLRSEISNPSKSIKMSDNK